MSPDSGETVVQNIAENSEDKYFFHYVIKLICINWTLSKNLKMIKNVFLLIKLAELALPNN